jgi:hypothetical protein
VRNVCVSVRQLSPGNVDLSELMLCVATIRNAFRLARKREEFLVAGGVVLADRGEGLVFIAEEEDFAPMSVGALFHLGDAVEHGTLEIKFHERADRPGQPRIETCWKVQRDDLALLD